MNYFKWIDWWIDWDLLETKFRDCVSFAATPIGKANVDRVIGMIHDLENLDDATKILRFLN